MGRDRGDDFRDIDSLGMFVKFGSSGLANERRDIVNFLKSLLDLGGHFIGFCQGTTRWQQYVDLDGAFVEGRQEIPVEPQ